MKKVPLKNYIIVFILMFFTISIVATLAIVYKTYNKKEESYISKNVTIVDFKELENYLQENSFAILYVDDIYNLDDNEMQKELLLELINHNLNNNIIFLNNNKNNSSKMKEKYNIVINNKKIILIFEDNSLVNAINIDNNAINILVKDLEMLGVIND